MSSSTWNVPGKTPSIELHRFWGKTAKLGESPERFHPAIHHMLDVAASARELWENGSPRLRAALEHAWRGCNLATFGECLPLIVALHDLGKISAAFQGQATNVASTQQRERLMREGVVFRSTLAQALYHQEISALWVHQESATYDPQIDRQLRWVIRDAISGHHGHFAQRSYTSMRGLRDATEAGGMPWDEWRASTYALLRELLLPSRSLSEIGTPENLRAATVALTGFIIWADWLGSNEKDFPACPDLPPAAYLRKAQKRAAKAMATHQLSSRRQHVAYGGFTTLFPSAQLRPRPLQALVDELPEDTFKRPTLVIVEAPTGEGKTEAALALARRIASAIGYEEVFFALPTMASGNEMFKRLDRFFYEQYGDAVRLTHSQAPAVEPELHRSVLSQDSDGLDDAASSAIAALQWFAGSKRAILAPLGVGTVDQLELAGLNVRHYTLRLLGLSRRVVVIDEVHAYDAYMSVILDHALQWFAALGSSVILLSATLPAHRHRALARSYLRGLDCAESTVTKQEIKYPVMAVYHKDAQSHYDFEPFRAEQQLRLRISQTRDYADDARHLLDLVRDGGAVARICNRVDDAQAIFRALQALEGDHQAVLLHARFPLEDRRAREKRISDLIGKGTLRTPEDKIIIVGTQVLEQSLDYDVDVMVSDFAPVDLLLQRAGRLHRHSRVRPTTHEQPVLEIVLPQLPEGRPDWGRWSPIYAPYVLWRTWEALNGHEMRETVIRLPADYRRLIEAVYVDHTIATPHEQYETEIERSRAAYARVIDAMKAQARTVLNPDAMTRGPITEAVGIEFVEEESSRAQELVAKTRLGDRVTLVPVFHDNGRWALDPTFSKAISADVPPPVSGYGGRDQTDFLAAAVPVSDQRIIAWYRRDDRPSEYKWPWREIPPLLRGMQPLPLNKAGYVDVGGCCLTLDRELGLIIEKEQL